MPQSEDFYISINSSYSSFVVGLLRRTDWAFAHPAKVGRSRKVRRWNQVVKELSWAGKEFSENGSFCRAFGV